MIRRDPLFKGCTRPAMVLGVPIVPLAAALALIVLLSVWTTILLIVSVIPVVIVMRLIVKTDDQQFRLLGLKGWCRLLPNFNHNRTFWKSSAYSPISFKKRSR